MLRPMAREETKGFLTGQMKFGVGDDVEEVEEVATLLPLRVLVIADLVPSDDFNAGASAPPGATRVSPSDLDELFGKLRPRIAVEVPSVLSDGDLVRVDLSPTSLKSFRPDGLFAEVPLLRSLLDGRLVLERLREGHLSELDARAELDRLWNGAPLVREVLGLLGGAVKSPEAPKAAPKPAAKTSVDDLLDLVDLTGTGDAAPAEEPPPAPKPAGKAAAPSKYGDLIAAFAKSARGGAGGKVSPHEAIARVEKAMGLQIGAILQHPEVRRLEESYRGLQALLERAGAHRGILFDVVSARAADMPAAFAKAIRAGAGAQPPVSFAVIDVDIDGTVASFALLEALGRVAEEAPCPAIVNATASMLGAQTIADIEKLDHKGGLFEARDRAPWRAVAAKSSMLWLSLGLNRVLARTAFTKATSRVREATVAEQPNDDSALVWLSPAWILGGIVVQSFRESGWPCRIVGPRSGGVLGNLQVREVMGVDDSEVGVAIPTEVFFSTETQRDLGKIGVLALAAPPNTDQVVLLSAATAYVPPPKRSYGETTAEPEARYERASLSDQLFVARVAQFLRALCSKLPPNADPSEAAELVEKALWQLFENAPPSGPEISVQGRGGGDGTSVALTLRPRRYLGVTLEEVSMEMPLG